MTLPAAQQAIRAKLLRPNAVSVDFAKGDIDRSIAQRFEKIVELFPERIAIQAVDRTATYAELNGQANRVARALLERRGAVAEPIALLCNNGIEQIAAMFGVLKAGKFFVPLDPSMPQARIANILKDCRAEMVIADRHNLPLAQELECRGDRLMAYHGIDGALAIDDLALAIESSAYAYVIYTSGSTGEPKGVIQSHRNRVHITKVNSWLTPVYVDDRVGFFSSGTATAIANIFFTLLNGAALVEFNIDKEGASGLAQWLQSAQITFQRLSPPLLRGMCQVLTGTENFSHLRMIRLGLETIYKTDIDLFQRYFPTSCVLFIGLASSEAELQRCYFVDHNTAITGPEVPVGYEVEDKEILLLDEQGNPAAIGEVGEIVVRSEYLSPGYWHRPELTDAKFQRDSIDPEKRRFLTGDLGLMLPDGCLIHKGRKDFRVKIRGYSVEIAEVEKALRRHTAIGEAVVVGRESRSAQTQLVAYFTPAEEQIPTTSALREFLSESLPEYMIPSVFVQLDKIPLSANGKVDRSALPEPRNQRPALNAPYKLPRNLMEQSLVQIWQEVLDVRPIGIHDNFFDLGGHSMLAVQLCSRIDKKFGKQLRPASLFEAPTVGQLANAIADADSAACRSALVSIQPKGSKAPFFWVHGDASGAYLPKYLGPDRPLFGLEHQSQDGKPARFTSVQSIAANYLGELRRIQTQGPYCLGGYSFGGFVALEIARQLKDQAQEVSVLALLDPPSPSNLRDRIATNSRHGAASVDSLYRRLQGHYRDASALGPRWGFDYVLRLCAGKLEELWSRIRGNLSRAGQKALITICLAAGRDLPPSVRSRYILDLYHRIRPQYEILPYSGAVVLFKSDDHADDYLRDWERLLVGRMQHYAVPGGHQQLREEPYVRVWAETLRACLDATQATHPRTDRRGSTI